VTESELSAAFGMPPSRAVEYFRSKGYRITFDYRAMEGEAHAKAFTIAKATDEVLQIVRGELDQAFSAGVTEREFIKRLEPRLVKAGWWGRQNVIGPDGNEQSVMLGSHRRLRTIYRTNLQTAYMAGRYLEFKANARARPYWMYVAIMDNRVRPSHEAMNGLVMRHDDPFWDDFFPPNGWGCRCRVRALSEANVRARGLTVIEGARYVKRQRVTDIHSGLVSEVGTFRPPWMDRSVAPDPGWSYNPGKAWSLWDQAGRLPDAIGEATAAASRVLRAVPGQRTWRDYGRPDAQLVPQAERRQAPALLPAQPSREAAANAVAIALGMPSDGSSIEVATPVETVVITRQLLPHIVDKRDNAREQFAAFVLPTLRDPWEVWLTEFEDGRVRPRYIGLYAGSRDTLVVVRRNADGSLVWNYINVNDRRLNAWREGWLAYQRPQRDR